MLFKRTIIEYWSLWADLRVHYFKHTPCFLKALCWSYWGLHCRIIQNKINKTKEQNNNLRCLHFYTRILNLFGQSRRQQPNLKISWPPGFRGFVPSGSLHFCGQQRHLLPPQVKCCSGQSLKRLKSHSHFIFRKKVLEETELLPGTTSQRFTKVNLSGCLSIFPHDSSGFIFIF